MGKPESYVEYYLRDRCKERGWLCYKFVSPANAGVPDRIVIGNGRVVFVELKSAVGKLSALQKAQIRHRRDNGADVRVINSRALVDDLIVELEQPLADSLLKELKYALQIDENTIEDAVSRQGNKGEPKDIQNWKRVSRT